MIKQVGNFANEIDWSRLVNKLTSLSGKVITSDPANWDTSNPRYKEITDVWIANHICTENMKWINYYPSIDFDQEIVDRFSSVLGVKVLRAWVSRVDPGWFVPHHWDVDDADQEYLKLGTPRRFTCFMNRAEVGQIIYINDDYLYNQEVGNTYEWNNYKDWHASANCSLSPKFLFNLLGY